MSESGCNDGIPQQLEVYFENFPNLSSAALAEFIDDVDPDEEESAEVGAGSDEEKQGLRLASFTVQLGELHMAVMLHSVPSPASPEVIGNAVLPPPMKEDLFRHRCFALLSSFGGEEDMPPYEHQIFLWKAALGLVEQGAVGVGSPWSGVCLPGEFLRQIISENRRLMDEEGGGVFPDLREEGIPREMMATTIQVKDAAGKGWLVTRGHAQCGFPDLCYQVGQESEEELEEIADMFDQVFAYMMQAGPVIEAGHTIGSDAEGQTYDWRFYEAPAVQWPFDRVGPLLRVEREAGDLKDRPIHGQD